ncbi:MAG TPA: FxsA family protein [Deltaproteobacteria bacterium]|nr:FxsA family protein [Deltaproteobacteria bacterium]
MFFRLFILFTLIPVIELALLIKVGSFLGVFNTVMIVIATALAGAYLVRLEGLGVMYRFQRNLSEGIFPAEEIFDGALLLVAGALLVTPGFFTDVLGLLIVIPATRAVIKARLRRRIEKSSTIITIDTNFPR